MSDALPIVYLARHGETAWSLSGRHTGLSDLPLTDNGERNAIQLGGRLRGVNPQRVLVSPLQRARRTCELAGFGDIASVDEDLVEWNYGAYEGRRTAEILAERPDWQLFRDGCPGGESPDDVMRRAERIVGRLRSASGGVIIFSSGHILRALAACWLGLTTRSGSQWILGTASLSGLGYEHDMTEPVIRFWNETTHVAE